VAVYRVEVIPRGPAPYGAPDVNLAATLVEAGLTGLEAAYSSRLFFIEGELTRAAADEIGTKLLADPVTELVVCHGQDEPVPGPPCGHVALEVHLRPGVMDPVAESTLAELQAEGWRVTSARTARRYVLAGNLRPESVLDTVRRVLANDCIEEVVLGTAGVRPAPQPPAYAFTIRHVPLRSLDDSGLEELSRQAHLFLSLVEMRAVRDHFAALGRDPTDLELETIAQTWSEHCIHKTLRSSFVYRGAPMPGSKVTGTAVQLQEQRYGNLLRETIVRATEELMAAGRGPECLSLFRDNAGVIAFDEEFGIAFKVETHNHPSAIEPYGGAATGVGGVIRDVIGCGLGAKPVAGTDVFCVGPWDWPADWVPKGVLHPRRVLRGVVRGVADYGNRMGIPTVSGTVYFDVRYLGNPLVYCGSVGLLPRRAVQKKVRPGDLIVLIGGRTGRDGIHGATFSSAELTDTHADEFSHAVQIGNPITEKRFLDGILRARDAEGGCLYTAITDCGAGGLSSAVGEMAVHTGAVVDLERVPLKYAGLRYDEIWISEAQERMVLAVPPANLNRFLQIMEEEEVEATVIGVFHDGLPADRGDGGITGKPRLVVRYQGQVVGALDLAFLHDGLPRVEQVAEWQPPPALPTRPSEAVPAAGSRSEDVLDQLLEVLRSPNVASKEWIVRQYDHEVQGGSVVKPLMGPGRGPADAAVLRPRLDSMRGIAVGCGLAPHLSDVDPYWMAAAAIDEAVRNVISVGGDPDRIALLDNFCWGRTDDRQQLGALVRACQACYDVATAYGTPFISGKDSLNNEFALDEADVEPLLQHLRARAGGPTAEARRLAACLPEIEQRVRQRRRLTIPSTLLISALSVVEDVRTCVTPDLKQAGDALLLVGGLPPIGYDLQPAAGVHRTIAELIRRGWVRACHDVSDGGWLVALAEMAFAGMRGVVLDGSLSPPIGPFEECCAAYLVETGEASRVVGELGARGVSVFRLGQVSADGVFRSGGRSVDVASLREVWSGRAP